MWGPLKQNFPNLDLHNFTPIQDSTQSSTATDLWPKWWTL